MFRKLILAATVAGALAAAALNAFASGASGHVTYTTAQSGGQVLVSIDAAIGSKPACNTASRYAINTTTLGGQSQYDLIKAAALTGRVVNLVGTTVCTIWSDSEDLAYITF